MEFLDSKIKLFVTPSSLQRLNDGVPIVMGRLAQRKRVLNVCVNETGRKERFFSAQAEKRQHDEPMGIHVILFI